MTLAVATCATLGDTGRQLAAGPSTSMLYLAVIAATGVRIAAALFSDDEKLLIVSAIGWLVAVVGYAVLFGEQHRPKPTAEGLEALPKDYSGIKPKAPALGLPLPGDLGRPILEHQRQLGLAPGDAVSDEQQRLAHQAIEARESKSSFRLRTVSASRPRVVSRL